MLTNMLKYNRTIRSDWAVRQDNISGHAVKTFMITKEGESVWKLFV